VQVQWATGTANDKTPAGRNDLRGFLIGPQRFGALVRSPFRSGTNNKDPFVGQIMSMTFSLSDVARHLGITRSRAYRELQTWPHKLNGFEPTFTADHMAEISRLINAGPDEHLARLLLNEQKRAALRAQEDFDVAA